MQWSSLCQCYEIMQTYIISHLHPFFTRGFLWHKLVLCISHHNQIDYHTSVIIRSDSRQYHVLSCTNIYFASGIDVYVSMFLAVTKQLYEWFSPSVRPSVHPSITPFWLCSHHRIIMKFSEVISNDRSNVHARSQGQRSKVKVTEVNTQLSRFRTVTPVWIQIWWWNDAQSLMLLRRGALLFLAATKQLNEWYFTSVCLSVRLSVCLSDLFDYVPIIRSSWNFQELLPMTKVMSMQKGQGQRSKVKGHRGHDPI